GTSQRRLGLIRPTFSMAASGTFGLYNHLVVRGADHVLGQPDGAWSTVSVVTAYLLFLIEAIGTCADLYFLCERHPRLWNRRSNSVDLKLFLSGALLRSADAKGKPITDVQCCL